MQSGPDEERYGSVRQRIDTIREQSDASMLQVVQTNQFLGPSSKARVIYFLLIGWWFSAIWMAAAYLVAVTIIGLPLALWLYNRIPWVLTLKQV